MVGWSTDAGVRQLRFALYPEKSHVTVVTIEWLYCLPYKLEAPWRGPVLTAAEVYGWQTRTIGGEGSRTYSAVSAHRT